MTSRSAEWHRPCLAGLELEKAVFEAQADGTGRTFHHLYLQPFAREIHLKGMAAGTEVHMEASERLGQSGAREDALGAPGTSSPCYAREGSANELTMSPSSQTPTGY